MVTKIAYLSRGRLHLKSGDAPKQIIESEFAKSVQERVQQIKRRNAWKTQSIMSNFFPSAMLRQLDHQEDPVVPVKMTGVCSGQESALFYAITAGDVTGIFTFEPGTTRESRLFHAADLEIQHLSFHPQQHLLACAIGHPTGESNIAIMAADGSRPNEVTEGDSVDTAPFWIPGEMQALVFQSAGIGRNSEGFPVAQGPSSIEKLDFNQQTVEQLASDPAFDFLGPQMNEDGTLYYIRRPYQTLRRQTGPLQLLRDLFLIPVRLIQAIFQWLSFFTQRHTGKPLLSLPNPSQENELNRMIVWGKVIDAALAAQQRDRALGEDDAPALVPKTWELVCHPTNTAPEVIAAGVLSYSLGHDGTLVYTNGSAIYTVTPDGVKTRIMTDQMIEHVMIIDQEGLVSTTND